MLSKEQILKGLPYLERADLEAVHAVAGHLLGGATGANPNGGATLGQTVFEALQATLGRAMPYSGLSARTNQRLSNRLPDLTKTLDQHFRGWDSNKVAQIAFLRMIFGLLAQDLKNRGVTPTFGIMIVNLNRVQEVVQNAFPDYLEAGLGRIILAGIK